MRRQIVLPLIVLAVGIAACGGSDESTSSSQVDTDATPIESTSVSVATETAATTTVEATSNSEPEDSAVRDITEPADLPETIPRDQVQPPAAVVGEVPDELLTPVFEDAAVRSGVGRADLVVLRSQEVQWNDGSLGCAEPGQVYTQAIVPGYWVVIDAGGMLLDYRLNDKVFFTLCEFPLPTFPEGPPTS